MKQLKDCVSLLDIELWLQDSNQSDANTQALKRAHELGRQQGWNEALNSSAEYVAEYLAARGFFFRIDSIRDLKMPTQEKEG
jgi:hypothetical protein